MHNGSNVNFHTQARGVISPGTTPEGKMKPGSLKLRQAAIILAMSAVLVFAVVLATAIGAVFVPFKDILKVIFKNWGLLREADITVKFESIIYFIRFPRVILAVLAGAALSVSGAVMQGMFKNPMADPAVIGVSSGAGLGAVLAINLGLTAGNLYVLPLFASAGALIAVTVIYLLSSRGGKVPVLTLILAGIAVSTFLNAITNAILTASKDYQVREYLFWSMGDLGGTMWKHIDLVVLPILLGILVMIFFARDLNVLLLGEEEAQSLGLNPVRTRRILLAAVSITTASAVCVSGFIGFVGLIVPHILRLILGPDHRILLPASALGGAIFLVGCDLIARVVVMPAEINVGIITSLIGAPYFLYLLIKSRKESGTL